MGDISPQRRKAMQAEAGANANGNGDFFNMKGINNAVIRLTPVPENVYIGRKRVVYFLNNKMHVCNEETHKKPGVIAKAVRALIETGDVDALEAAKSVKGARRCKFVMKVVERSNPTKVVWYEAPQTVYNAIFSYFKDDGEDISNRKDGRDIRISKKGAGKDTEYSIRPMDPSPLAPTKDERTALVALADAMDVEGLLRVDEEAAIDALKAVIPAKVWKLIAKEVLGDATDSDDSDADAANDLDDEDEVAPAAKPKAAAKVDDEDEAPRAAAKPSAKPVDDEDDTPPPAAKANKAAAARTVDDEDDAPPAKPAAKGKPVVIDDEDDEAPAAKKKHQVDDDDE